MRRGVPTDHQKQLFQYLGIGGNQGGEMRDGGQRWEVCRVWDLQGPDTANANIFTSLMQCFRSGKSVDPDPDPGGQNDPQKEKKKEEI